METFLTKFEECVRANLAANPSKYAYGPEKVPEMIAKMRVALANDSYLISESVVATCKAFGIKATKKAINHFIANHV